ncbi:hypothetical protein VCHC39A1_0370, partial [Vibrio cholerae HC-39A1]
MEQLGS